jgi:D-3-phosphoglycerate dehydrogenase / 2-oxoglutarate reductase
MTGPHPDPAHAGNPATLTTVAPPGAGEGKLQARVIVEPPIFPLEAVRPLLAGTNVAVEAPPRPWSGDDVVGLLVWQAVSDADMARLPRLRAVVTGSIGVDHIDLVAAKRRGIWVCNVPDYCVDEVADTTIALLLALVRGVVALDRSVRNGQWNDHAAGALPRLSDTRLGIIGFGRTGRAVARRAIALGIETWASDPIVAGREIAKAGATPASIEDLLRQCTAVTIHAPLTPATEHLMGARELALMPRGSYLINTARGQLVDTDAVLAALDDGRLAGAALDVLAVEPPTASHPPPRHPKLIVTPHAAWFSSTSEREVVRRATSCMRTILDGHRPDDGVVVAGREGADGTLGASRNRPQIVY